jgi:hypothetical protein
MSKLFAIEPITKNNNLTTKITTQQQEENNLLRAEIAKLNKDLNVQKQLLENLERIIQEGIFQRKKDNLASLNVFLSTAGYEFKYIAENINDIPLWFFYVCNAGNFSAAKWMLTNFPTELLYNKNGIGIMQKVIELVSKNETLTEENKTKMIEWLEQQIWLKQQLSMVPPMEQEDEKQEDEF